MLTEQQGTVLLRLARQTIEEQLGQTPTDPVATADLEEQYLKSHCGVFVTLNKQGMLRGCIGSLLGVESIVEGVRRHAVNAAIHDHRFPMLTVEEIQELQINISVLTPPRNLEYRDGTDLLEKLRPGIDGVILKIPGGNGATFLPQVWEQLPVAEQFLQHLSLKAGLDSNSWQSGQLTVQTYQVQHFTEE